MASLRRFSDPDWLRTFSPERLCRLLNPWRDYLSQLGCDLPDGGQPDYTTLAAVLFAAGTSCPVEMIDALYYVSATATTEDMEKLLEACEERGVPLPEDPLLSPADCSIEVWLRNPELLEERHAESLARGQRSFEYFQAKHARPFPELAEGTRRQIETAFDDWFVEKRRGRGCRLFVFREAPHTWLLVRHGRPMRREPSHSDDGEPTSAFFRPQTHDVLRYDDGSGEIGVHAGTKGERNLYLSTLGRVLFENPDQFPTAPKFTLTPLQQRGAPAMACDDVDGIEAIQLVEYRTFWGGEFKESETRRADDVFAALADRGVDRIGGQRLSAATFRAWFEGARKPRSITIRPPAVARYERSEDSQMFEPWLQARGFLVHFQPEDEDDALTEVLEDT